MRHRPHGSGFPPRVASLPCSDRDANQGRALRPRTSALRRGTGVTLVLLLASGCSMLPRGWKDEQRSMMEARAALGAAGRGQEPAVPRDGNDWRSLLLRAFATNGDLKAAWFEWKAAMEEARGASSWPDTNLAIGYSRMFSKDSMKSFDRSTFSAGVDSMQNLSFPGKTMAAGRGAQARARAAGERFRASKFSLQRSVLDAWLDLVLAAEAQRLASDAKAASAVGTASASATGPVAMPGRGADAAMQEATRDAEAIRADAAVRKARVTLAALVGVNDPDAIPVPTRLPEARALSLSRAAILDAAAEAPTVKQALRSREAAVADSDLARLQWIPNVNPTAMATGTIEQSVGAMVMLPTRIVAIRAGIASARAMRAAAGAALLQAHRDARARAEAALVAARSEEDARDLLAHRILPLAMVASASAREAWASGNGELDAAIEAADLEREARRDLAMAAVERERALAMLEETLGADLEALAQRHDPVLQQANTPATSKEGPR